MSLYSQVCSNLRHPVVLLAAFTSFTVLATEPGGTEVLARVNGEPITAAELEAEIRPQLEQLEQEAQRLRETVLVRLIERKLIEQAARQRNLTVEEFLERELGQITVSDEEVEAAWVRARNQFPAAIASEVKYRLRRKLEDQRRASCSE